MTTEAVLVDDLWHKLKWRSRCLWLINEEEVVTGGLEVKVVWFQPSISREVSSHQPTNRWLHTQFHLWINGIIITLFTGNLVLLSSCCCYCYVPSDGMALNEWGYLHKYGVTNLKLNQLGCASMHTEHCHRRTATLSPFVRWCKSRHNWTT